jgi:hypothetical protein
MKQVVAFVLAAAALQAADARLAIEPDALIAHVKFLASDELEGRGNGSKGLEKAGDYIADRFKAAGLEPGGEKGSWFQGFELMTGLTVGESNRLRIEANGQSVTFALGDTYFPLSATANDNPRAPSASLEHAPVVFAGYGISAAALGYDDYAGVDVKNKAVLVFTHEPQENDPKSRFEGRELTDHATLLTKAMTARRHGARVLLVVSDPTHERDEAPYKGFTRDPQAEDYGIPVLRVHRDRIKPLLEQWKLDQAAKQIDAAATPQSHPLAGATVDYTEHLAKTRRTVRNVIGILRGTSRADEAVVIGAHYDHLGLGGRHSLNPSLAGQIHNGADDNASGTASLIEIARTAAAHRERFARTMVFVAFAGEELGLIGSAQYVSHPAVPLDDTIAMINLDMVGRPRGKIMISGLETAPAVSKDVDAAAATIDGLEIKRFQEGAGVGSSDDTSFALKKIPAIGFFSGFHGDYHRPTDDWQLIEGRGAATVASLAYELAARLASRPDKPEYVARTAAPAGHGTPSSGDAGSIGGYGPYFGSVPDFGENDTGVKFAEVRDGSPAAKAGLKAGDVMVEFDGKPIKTLYDFTFALREKRPGDEVVVKVMRGTEPVTAKVALTTRP